MKAKIVFFNAVSIYIYINVRAIEIAILNEAYKPLHGVPYIEKDIQHLLLLHSVDVFVAFLCLSEFAT